MYHVVYSYNKFICICHKHAEAVKIIIITMMVIDAGIGRITKTSDRESIKTRKRKTNKHRNKLVPEAKIEL